MLIADDIVFTAMAPRALGDLVAIRKRIKRGNARLKAHNQDALGVPQNTLGSLVKTVLKSPRHLLGGGRFCGGDHLGASVFACRGHR